MSESDGVKREKIRVLICGHDGSRIHTEKMKILKNNDNNN